MKRAVLFLAVVSLFAAGSRNTLVFGEEEFGNGPVNPANYIDRPGILPLVNDTHRVYRWWINGQEQLFYRGDSIGLNSAFEQFAMVDTARREVVLCPAPGAAVTLDRSRKVRFQWKLQLVGGIAAHLGRRDRGQKIWPSYPVMFVYVGGPIQLSELQIPRNLDIISLSELKKRYRLGLESTSQDVRGLSCGLLSGLDPFDHQSMKAIAGRLGDESVWVRTKAAVSLADYGRLAVASKSALQAAKQNADETLADAVEDSLRIIDQASSVPQVQRDFQQSLAAIEVFLENHKKD